MVDQWRRREVSPRENSLARWLLLLEGSENEDILTTLEEIAMHDPVLHQAMTAWETSSDDPKVRTEYDLRQKAIFDEKAAVREAELRLQEGIAEGEARGEARGEAKGLAKGKAEVAKNLLDLGIEIPKISQATGLSEEEVKALNT